MQIGIDDLLRVGRLHETGIQLAYRQQHSHAVSVEKSGRGLVAPTLTGPALFVDGQTLGEPPRDLMLREPEVEHVGEFVPEDGRPVEISDGPGGGRVHSDKASEGDAESTHTR